MKLIRVSPMKTAKLQSGPEGVFRTRLTLTTSDDRASKMAIAEYKRCPKCGETKFAQRFFRHKNRRDGLASWCSACMLAYQHGQRSPKPAIRVPDGMKRCCTCKEIRQQADFAVSRRERDGLQRRCRSCTRTRKMARYIYVQREVLPHDVKRCRRCKDVKPRTDFTSSTVNRDGLYSYCHPCVNATNKERIRRDPARHRARILASKLRRKYGLTREQFAEMQVRQGHTCAICAEPTEDFHIDHDHQTRRVRALLCHKCNVGLGHYNDNADLLRRAADYLDHHRALPELESA
jgi:hypothetical protein